MAWRAIYVQLPPRNRRQADFIQSKTGPARASFRIVARSCSFRSRIGTEKEKHQQSSSCFSRYILTFHPHLSLGGACRGPASIGRLLKAAASASLEKRPASGVLGYFINSSLRSQTAAHVLESGLAGFSATLQAQDLQRQPCRNNCSTNWSATKATNLSNNMQLPSISSTLTVCQLPHLQCTCNVASVQTKFPMCCVSDLEASIPNVLNNCFALSLLLLQCVS